MKKSGKTRDKPVPEGWEKERRYQRAEADLNARFYHKGKWYPAKIITISAGGGFLACRPPAIARDDLVELALELEGCKVNAISRVVWVNHRKLKNKDGYPYPPGFAVEFEKIFGEMRAQIDNFVKESLRTLRALVHELAEPKPDREMISRLFLSLRPGDSTHLNHIQKTVREEFRYFRLRKLDN